jgi:hypothetical protein
LEPAQIHPSGPHHVRDVRAGDWNRFNHARDLTEAET